MTTPTDAAGIQMDGATAAVILHRTATITVPVSRAHTVSQGRITATVMMDARGMSTGITTAPGGRAHILVMTALIAVAVAVTIMRLRPQPMGTVLMVRTMTVTGIRMVQTRIAN